MRLKIVGVHQFLRQIGGFIKKYILGELSKKGDFAKKEGGGCFRGEVNTLMHAMTWLWCVPKLKIGLADVSEFNFDHSFLQINAKKKTNAKSSIFIWV